MGRLVIQGGPVEKGREGRLLFVNKKKQKNFMTQDNA
jgi:hypothetical protein